MTKVKVNTLKQCPYGYARTMRVDPTEEGIRKAIQEGRFSTKIMGHDYEDVKAAIHQKAKTPFEADLLMREYHNERIAELVRTKEAWLGKADQWPITINQFNEIIEGNHRFRAIRYLGLVEVEVNIVQETAPRGHDQHDEIW